VNLRIMDLYKGEDAWPQLSPFLTLADAAEAITALVGIAIITGESSSYAIVDEDERVHRVVTTSCFVATG